MLIQSSAGIPQRATPGRLLRIPEVIVRTGLSKSSINSKWRNGTFPQPVRISERAIAFPEEAIDQWMAERPFAREQVATDVARSA